MSFASIASVSGGHPSSRTRSRRAASSLDAPRAAAHVHISRHSDMPAPRRPPTLPPLDLPGEIIIPSLHSAPANPSRMTEGVPLFQDPRREPAQQATNQADPQDNGNDGLLLRLATFLGFASGEDAKARRQLLSLIFNLSSAFAQLVIIVTLLAYSGYHESPTVPGKTEWHACDKPLGTWNALWLIRAALCAFLEYWSWKRQRANRLRRERRLNNSDAELATQRYLNGQPHYPTMGSGATRMPRHQSSRATGLSYEGASDPNTDSSNHASEPLARLSLFESFLSLAWFLTAHVLAYTSVNTCRLSAPHLWWLTFGILCILYVLILEIFLLGLLVFILGPVLYLVWNIVLLCLGRHPLQNPHYIKPEIGQLPKSIVQQIPLVLYIPPPPGESADGNAAITVPPAAYAYPPGGSSAATATSSAPKRRFAWLRRKGASKNKARISPQEGGTSEKGTAAAGKRTDPGDTGQGEEEDVPWDEMWEKGEYPFVRLEGNRAVCAICLMDFEEPRRVRGPKPTGHADHGPPVVQQDSPKEEAGMSTDIQEIQVEEITEEERNALQLDDAREQPQPLRLLPCGHAFHQTCVDPWLIDVSGRCPTCQRPVEIGKPSKKAKRRRRT
ncbi:hypothetical protein BD414DRAFT_482963 [Trametes punicea]|nr:hypothetical protein BD414DRAFT_482963 [Trametes punicea]